MAVLILAKHDNAHLNDATAKPVTAAKAMGGDITVLVAGESAGAVAEAAAKLDGVAKVLLADGDGYEHMLAEPVAALVHSLAGAYDAIVAPATTTGKNVMPRVAALLDVMQVSEIVKVRLIEIERFWGGKAKEKEVRKANDLFMAWDDDWAKRLAGGSIDRAVFKVKFDGDGKERTVAILPPSLARYDRDADSDLIDRWLKDQGFCRLNVGDEDDDVGVLEDD